MLCYVYIAYLFISVKVRYIFDNFWKVLSLSFFKEIDA